MDIKIIVAAHKPYRIPEDSVYLPVHVGKALNPVDLGFPGDNTGEHISGKNKNYCELTGLYWAWKNLEADAVGLAHYRRHFTVKGIPGYKLNGKWESVLTGRQAEALLARAPVILPNKRRYFIETGESHYAHAHQGEALDMTRSIIRETAPEYADSFEDVMKRTWAHMFNMFIMRKDILDAYCEWLFGILFLLEERLDISGYSANDARVFGYISEMLLDVWLKKNGHPTAEIHAMFMEKQDWIGKSRGFLYRKLFAKRRRPRGV